MSGSLLPIQALMFKPVEVLGSLAGVYVDGANKIVSETQGFSQATIRANTAGFQKQLAARSVGELIQAQAEQAKENFNSSVGEMEKIGDILIDLTNETVSIMRTAPEGVMSQGKDAPPAMEPHMRRYGHVTRHAA